MNKKLLAAGLSLTMVLPLGGVSQISAAGSTMNPTSQQEMTEVREYLFDVVEVKEGAVKLRYKGEHRNDAIEINVVDENEEITLDRKIFGENVSPKDEYKIKSKSKLADIKADDIKKDDVELIQKYEKPVNMDIDKLPENTEKLDFEVLETTEDSLYPSAVVGEIGNKDNKYSLSFDSLRDEDVKVGDQYTIYWDGISLTSYPAQFGKIFRVDKLNKDSDKKEVQKKEFEVIEISDEAVTIAETTNKNNLYTISKKDLRDGNPLMGDRYMITWSGNSTRSYPAKFIDIVDVEKWMKKDEKDSQVNRDKLDKALERAEAILNGTTTYNKETATKFIDSLNYAADLKEKNPSQEEVDKASKDLNDAIDGLSEKDKVLTFTFEIAEIVDKGGKNVRLRSVDDKDWDFLYDYDSLNDKDVKVGDRYHIDFDGMEVARNTSKYGDILNINKIDYQKENPTADKKPIKDENKASEKKEEVKKDEAKKEEKKIGFGNPSTGISSVMPVVGIAGFATVGYLASRKKK